jgi:hypothetical protein
LFRQNWVVYAKPPFGGPHHVLGYLARYTHRVAITNHRFVAFQHDQVTFRWKDYAHGNKKRMMTLGSQEFLLHVLPRGFVRIRSLGFLANRRRANTVPGITYMLAGATQRSDADPYDKTSPQSPLMNHSRNIRRSS